MCPTVVVSDQSGRFWPFLSRKKMQWSVVAWVVVFRDGGRDHLFFKEKLHFYLIKLVLKSIQTKKICRLPPVACQYLTTTSCSQFPTVGVLIWFGFFLHFWDCGVYFYTAVYFFTLRCLFFHFDGFLVQKWLKNHFAILFYGKRHIIVLH